MADFDKLYEMTVENNTNIKHVLEEQREIKEEIEKHDTRLNLVENKGKKTAGDHLISFSKVCGAFLLIGSLFTFVVKMSEKIWP